MAAHQPPLTLLTNNITIYTSPCLRREQLINVPIYKTTNSFIATVTKYPLFPRLYLISSKDWSSFNHHFLLYSRHIPHSIPRIVSPDSIWQLMKTECHSLTSFPTTERRRAMAKSFFLHQSVYILALIRVFATLIMAWGTTCKWVVIYYTWCDYIPLEC
jgi:hypothetical protein